jgi:hypothetical protein
MTPSTANHGVKTLWRWLHAPQSGAQKGALVPIGWAAYNAGLWVAILAGFGTHNAQVLWLALASQGIIFLFGLAVYVNKLRHPIDPTRRRLPLRGDAGMVAAFGTIFIGLGVIFGSWWYPFAAIFWVAALWLVAKDYAGLRRKKVNSPVQ